MPYEQQHYKDSHRICWFWHGFRYYANRKTHFYPGERCVRSIAVGRQTVDMPEQSSPGRPPETSSTSQEIIRGMAASAKGIPLAAQSGHAQAGTKRAVGDIGG